MTDARAVSLEQELTTSRHRCRELMKESIQYQSAAENYWQHIVKLQQFIRESIRHNVGSINASLPYPALLGRYADGWRFVAVDNMVGLSAQRTVAEQFSAFLEKALGGPHFQLPPDIVDYYMSTLQPENEEQRRRKASMESERVVVPVGLQLLYLEKLELERRRAAMCDAGPNIELTGERRQMYVDHNDAIYDYLKTLNARIALEEREAGIDAGPA